jgi:hypothetical protein
MQQNSSLSAPKKGMNRSGGGLKNFEYTFALNANTSSEVDDSLEIQKEPSNRFGVLFPSTYKVIGHRNDIIKNRTYYLLTSIESNSLSPNYKRSSFGYADNTIEETFNQDEVVDGCKECTKKGNIDAPLETITQTPSQTYVELAHDRCISVADIEEQGFNFDINSPIKKIELQQEKLGTLLYWEDSRNPSRYINVTDLEENTPNYLHIQEIPCGTDIVTDCILIDKLLVFPKHSKIIIEAKEEQIGGNLKMGTYEFYAVYCDISGNNMSQYSTPTNPISIFDENNNIQAQTTTDEFTNFAIKLQIKNLDTKNFKYYKVAVVERNNVQAQQSVFLAGIYPTTDDTVVYTHSGSNNDDLYVARGNVAIRKRMDFSELGIIKPTYEKFKGTMVSGNALWHFGATVKEELNLQPAINLFSILHWSSSLAKEDLYKYAIATSKYKGYMRNEVQPFSIRLYNKDGSYSANFPLIGRPKNTNDALPVTDTNFDSIDASTNVCGVNERTERWQVFNTATKYEDVCDNGLNEIITEPETIKKSCTADIAESIPADTIEILLTEGEEFISLEDYLETHTVPEITPYIEDGSGNYVVYPEHCDVVFNGDCGAPTLLPNSVVQIQEIIGEINTYNPKIESEYQKSVPPSFCSPYKQNVTTGDFERDVEMEEFVGCDGLERKKVYYRNGEFLNESCGYAVSMANQTDPTQAGTTIFMNYQGSLTLADLKQADYPVDATTIVGNFYDKLHKKAQFFKASKNGISTGNSRISATLTGSSGNASLVIGGVTYTTAFITSLTLTAAAFVTAHAAAILTATGAIVTSTGAIITIQAPTPSFPTITVVAGGLTETLSAVEIIEELVLELTKKTNCPPDRDNLPVVSSVRYTIYKSCTDLTVLGGGIVDLTVGEVIILDTTLFPSKFIVAIDAPIITEVVPITCSIFGGATHTVYKVVPPCGCFSIYTRNIEDKSVTVSWTSILLEKVEEYESECTFSIPSVGSCGVVPYQKGEFAFWESIETYPDNKQLYDSSGLFIKETDLDLLSVIDKAYFIEYYTDGGSKDIYGNYILKDADLTCQPIRHFKFPDNTVSPYIFALSTAKADSQSLISPLGIEIDSNAVKAMLQVAVNNKLITQKQLNNIQGYEILRGDNSIHKSVIANGIASDIYNYTKKDQVIHYANFPFNDLGENKFCLNSNGKPIQHPYGGDYNHLFSFISPDVFLTKPTIPSEVSLQGYIFGSTNSAFTQVDKHSKWTVLGQNSRDTATTLAILEVALESTIKAGELTSQQWFTFGVSSGTSLGLVGAGIAAGAYLIGAFTRIGKYRYEWLKIFKDLGRTENFASFQTASSNYNRFLPTDQYSPEYLRRLAIRKYMRDGDFTFTDENNGDTLKVNNWLREHSVFLSTDKAFPFNYPTDYKNFDNNKVNSNSSTFTSSQVDCESDKNYVRNVASPYFSLKNYIPDQWGQIDSIKWLTTNYIFDLDDNTVCSPILGGTVCVSRFSWRKKTPIFTSNAIDEPDKLPFLYSRYDNIGTPRFYCDYEVGGVWKKYLLPFPDINSTARFDCESGKNEFYYKHPSKFYLYTHGVVNFLVESEINCNFRYARNEPKDWFYPQNQNLPVWLQEKHLPISEPNTFFYNNTYTFPVSNTPYKFLDKTYDKEVWEKRRYQPNAWVWSEKDVNENSLINPWLIYKPLNWFEDKSNKGHLIDLRSIESEQFLGRFENQLQLYNTIDNLAERVTPQNKETGTGFFYQRPIEFKTSELGFAGTQNTDICSTPYGHFWADAKRGRVFQLDQNGKGLEIISEAIQNQPSGMKQWFREHLPFKILKSFPQADIDNKFKGLGMNIWYDDRMSRVFFTKRDYVPKGVQGLNYNDEIGFYTQDSNPPITCPVGYTYNDFTGLCELISTNSACPIGFVYNELTNMCEQANTCEEGLDIVFVLDATGSQQTSIDNIKNAIISDIVPAIVSTFGTDYRLGLVSVKDRRADGQALFDILEPMALANQTTFVAQINTIVATGGAGTEEPTDLAIGAVLNNTSAIDRDGDLLGGNTIGAFRPNSAKTIILVTDTLPSGLDDDFDYTDWLSANAMATQANVQGIQIFSYLTSPTEPVAVPPIPLVQFPNVTYIMQNYASVTNGTYYFTPLGVGISDGVVDAIVSGIECPPPTSQAPSCEEECVQNLDECNCLDTIPPTIGGIKTPVYFDNTTYFEDVSWTISYKPTEGTWNSYFSFYPDYSPYHQNMFQVGYNWGQDKGTLWNHLMNNQSFGVFQGKLHTFAIEFPIANENVNKILNSLSLNVEPRRYQNQWDYSIHKDKSFSEGYIWNSTNNSGWFSLNPQKTLADNRKYPQLNGNKQEILFTSDQNRQTFDYFFNRVANQDNNISMFSRDKNNIFKTVNSDAVKFLGKRMLERMKGQEFLVYLQDSKNSRFNLILKNSISDETIIQD